MARDKYLVAHLLLSLFFPQDVHSFSFADDVAQITERATKVESTKKQGKKVNGVGCTCGIFDRTGDVRFGSATPAFLADFSWTNRLNSIEIHPLIRQTGPDYGPNWLAISPKGEVWPPELRVIRNCPSPPEPGARSDKLSIADVWVGFKNLSCRVGSSFRHSFKIFDNF